MIGRINQKILNEQNNFLAISKDWSIITEKLIKNDKLLKLIYYNTSDALSKPNLTDEEKEKLINKNILPYPYIPEDDDVENYIQVLFDNFLPNRNNTQYIDNTIIITILCNRQNWILENWQIRLYSIANEIMNMINNQKFSGIGRAEFIGGASLVPSEHVIGMTLNFNVVNSLNEREEDD